MDPLQANTRAGTASDADAAHFALRETAPFGRGGNRLCFVHPEHPGRCIKVIRPDRTPELMRRSAPWFKRLRPLRFFDENERERRTFEGYEKHYPDSIWDFIPRCHGMVATDHGPGIVTDLIRDADGSIAPTLEARMKADDGTDVIRAIDEFKALVSEHLLVTRDLLLHNIVAPRIEGDRLKLYLVDGLGCANWLPIAYYDRRIAEKKVRRKLARFDRTIESKREHWGLSERP